MEKNTRTWRNTTLHLEPYQTSILTAKITLSAYFSSLFGSYPSPYTIHDSQALVSHTEQQRLNRLASTVGPLLMSLLNLGPLIHWRSLINAHCLGPRLC